MKNTLTLTLLSALAAAAPSTLLLAADGGTCETLTKPGIFTHTLISSAKAVPADTQQKLPAYCEIVGTVTPVANSRIGVVYRLPENWNGKLLGLGGGGWAGNLRLDAAAPGLIAGYATAQTDGGHASTELWNTSWSANPEAIEDFSHRAIHVMTTTGKSVVSQFYGRQQTRSYYQGCSTGGRQGLMEVQRYPDDYDGVIAGAPVYTLATQTTALIRSNAFARPGASVTANQLSRLNDAALAACDASDGTKDGVLNDPRACRFNPSTLQCKTGETGECLTAAQVTAIQTMYAGVKTQRGEFAAYPLTRGSERGWERFIPTTTPATSATLATTSAGAGLGGLRATIFGDANFDLAKFDPDQHYRIVRDSRFANIYEAGNPDISAFIAKGGKLLLWHGFDDPGPSPFATVDYFTAMQRVTGEKIRSLDNSARLFLAPGVYHCRGGPGPDEIDMLSAIDAWVESGQAPNTLLATKAEGGVSRPLCPYPALARYKGSGNTNDVANFNCRI